MTGQEARLLHVCGDPAVIGTVVLRFSPHSCYSLDSIGRHVTGEPNLRFRSHENPVRQNSHGCSFADRHGGPAGRDRPDCLAPGGFGSTLRKTLYGYHAERNVSPDPRPPAG